MLTSILIIEIQGMSRF